MSGDLLNDIASSVLERALDGLALRQQVISNNIANVDTPGFKASEVSFEQVLRRQLADDATLSLERTHQRHLAASTQASEATGDIWVTVRSDTTLRNDGNNVDIDREMVELAETAIRYHAVARLMARRLAILRTIAREAR
ncbi:MAG TPA: flagellar basal body rod protein FlgB [Anaerolineae bacterium]|nr:flagellar basal body rod protein FlgB [Anaerolineae bacterium]